MAALMGGFGCLTASGQDVLVDLELSLVVDVSGSVDTSEFILQMEGYASAFDNATLQSAIFAGNRGQIVANLVQFSDSAAESIPWTVISDSTSASAFAASIRAAARLFSGSTGISSGIDTSVGTFTDNGFDAPRQVIDVSGDGSNNTGRDPGLARDDALAAGIDTINGIVIADSDGSLTLHYEQEVVSPDGFVETADTFEDFAPAILRKLAREISGDEFALPVTATSRFASIALARSHTQNLGGRLARLRAGLPNTMVQPEAPAPATGGKGGMANSVITPAAVEKRWEVYGTAYYFNQTGDEQIAGALLIVPDYDMDVFGGNVGIEYRINNQWSVGAAFGASTADIDMNRVGTADIDSIALMPYVSYVRREAFRNADFYADLLYGYSDQSYDSNRIGGFHGSTDGNANTLEFNTGLNFKAGAVTHGPIAALRWIDGEMDAYNDGGIAFPKADYKSLATNLGYQVSYQMPMGDGVLVPQLTAAWEHEFEGDPAFITGVPLGQLDEDLAVLGAGISWYARTGWNLGLFYEGRFGDTTNSNYVGLKGGYEF